MANFLKQWLIRTCWLCPVKLFGSFSITFECISFSLFSGCLRRNAKISKGTRSTNSRTPDLKSSDSPWQSYKKAPPRVEGSFRWNEPLKIWKFPGFVRKSLLFLWPCATFSLTLKRTVTSIQIHTHTHTHIPPFLISFQARKEREAGFLVLLFCNC